VNKNEIAKTYKSMAKDSAEELKMLINQYHQFEAVPRQVAGEDGSLSGVY